MPNKRQKVKDEFETTKTELFELKSSASKIEIHGTMDKSIEKEDLAYLKRIQLVRDVNR